MTQLTSGIKKIIAKSSTAVGVAATALLAPLTAFAGLRETVNQNLGVTGTATGLNTTANLPTMIGTIIQSALGLVGIVLVVFIIYAGFLWMTAQGNEEQVTKAKDILKNAIIGMVIMFTAYAITNFVVSAILSGTGT
jgi:hypothetical protein